MSEWWWEYVQRVAAHASNRDIAAAAQMDASAMTRWKQGDKPRAENVIAFARAYNRPPMEALVAAGYITAAEAAETVELHPSLREYSTDQLLDELRRRVVAG